MAKQQPASPPSSQSASSLPPITNVWNGPATPPTIQSDDAAIRQKMQSVINSSPQLPEDTRRDAQEMLDAPPNSENSLAEHRRVNNPITGAWGVPPTIGSDGVAKVWHLGDPIQTAAERAQNAVRLDITSNGTIYAVALKSATPMTNAQYEDWGHQYDISPREMNRDRSMTLNNEEWIRISGPGPDTLAMAPHDLVGSITAAQAPDLITQLQAASGSAPATDPAAMAGAPAVAAATSAPGVDGGQAGGGQGGSGGGDSGGQGSSDNSHDGGSGSDSKAKGQTQKWPNLAPGTSPHQMEQLLENAMNMPGGWPPANPGLRHQMHDELRAAAGQLKEPGGHSGSADMAGFGGGATDPSQAMHSHDSGMMGGGGEDSNPLGGFSADAHAGHGPKP